MVPHGASICASIFRLSNIIIPRDSALKSHSSQTTPAEVASRTNSPTLIAESWHAEDSISSGVPPPLPSLAEVDEPELDVELRVCDVLVEASGVVSGDTVVPTIATLVVVASGMTVVGTIVVVEDVAAALGVEDVAAAWGVEDVDVVELVLVLVVDVVVVDVLIVVVLASVAID